MISAKQVAAKEAIEHVRNGMTIGLGTGSTAFWAIEYIGMKVKEGLSIKAIATSIQTETVAREREIPIISFADTQRLDITIDGADEVDLNLQLIKGGGGALLREKIVAAASLYYIIIIDESKLVQKLGSFKLPVEVIPFGHEISAAQLTKLGCQLELRAQKNSTFVTDNGNYILDCQFDSIEKPGELHEKINAITGVVDNGLFVDMADLVIIGSSDGTTRSLRKMK